MRRSAWLAWLALAACSDDGTVFADDTVATSGMMTSGPASDASGAPDPSGGDSEGSSGSEGGGEVASSLEECIAQGVIELDCSGEAPGTQWVAFAPELGCSGSAGASTDVARFLFRLDEVVDDEAQIRGLRLGPPEPAATDQRLEFTAESPVPYGQLSLLLVWPSVLTQMPLAGGLSFLDATPDTSTCALESIPAWTDLGTGATLRGSFELGGGTLTVLDEDGNPTTLISEGFALRGCFSLPAESYALELDE